MSEELKHSGDCSFWISPICDCGILRHAISDGKTVLVNGACVASQWAGHLAAIDTQRHASCRMDDPDTASPGSAVTMPSLEAPGFRTIQDDIDEYKRLGGCPTALHNLVDAVIGLKCPNCDAPVPVSFQC